MQQRAGKCGLAIAVEVRIRLVEDDEFRIAEEGARQSYALFLTARQRGAVSGDQVS